MERIEKTLLISAPAEQVFSLIEKFEEIPKFSSAISEVCCESDKISLWKIEVGGITHDWRAELLEKKPPKRLTWHSISGIQHRGGYELEQIDGKTKVNFFMEYQLPSRVLERVLHAPMDRMIEEIYSEILTNIQNELEVTVEKWLPK
jgi:uncharacterized membrane protein